MDDKHWEELLFAAMKQTIEEMGFLEVERSPREVKVDTLECVSIRVLKPFLGRVYLFFAPEMKYEIVRNLYGKDVVAEKEAQDAILEVLNVLAGRFLTELSDNGEYEMEFPQWEYERISLLTKVTDISCYVDTYEARMYVVKEER